VKGEELLKAKKYIIILVRRQKLKDLSCIQEKKANS